MKSALENPQMILDYLRCTKYKVGEMASTPDTSTLMCTQVDLESYVEALWEKGEL